MQTMEQQVDDLYGMYKKESPRKQWEEFARLERYIDTLVKVHSVGHRADKEIDEAVEKLRELTYA